MKTKNEILDALRFGICVLVYNKLDGSTRYAFGTLNTSIIPEENRPKTNVDLVKDKEESITHTGLIHYYDMDRKGWRCFLVDNLVSLSYFG
jgi:hypothetical protein